MHEDERDLLEVLTFDEIEETVGTWLQAIIQRLEKEQTAIRRDHRKQRTPGGEKLKGTLLYQRHHPKSASRRVRLRWTGGKFFRFRADPCQECFAVPLIFSISFPSSQAASVATLPSALFLSDFSPGASWVFSIQQLLLHDNRPRFPGFPGDLGQDVHVCR
jgi:hypothetical protein